MASYLIDYENVHHHGLAGVEKLSNKDYVVLFLGKTNTSVHVEAAVALTKTEAKVLWKKTDGSGRNCLDIQIATYLGSLVSENKERDFFIISKDQGFIAAIDFWKTRKKDITITLQDETVPIVKTTSRQG
jgi:hypothetical protein